MQIHPTVLGHVVYVTEEEERGDGLGFLVDVLGDPVVLAGLLLLVMTAGAVGAGYLRWRPLRRDIVLFREVLSGYRDLLPWLLRLGFGLPLIGAGFGGDWFNPITSPIVPAIVARLVQLALGFAILFGIATRIAALGTLVIYLVSVPVAPGLLWSPEWIPGLIAIGLLGGGRPSADQVLDRIASAEGTVYGRIDPVHHLAPHVRRYLAPARRFVPTIVRVGLGSTFIALGIGEKLLAPAMGADVVAQYELTGVIPFSVSAWIASVGLAEATIGLALVLGVFTRFAALAALGIFVLTLFTIPDDPVIAHIGLFAMCSALLVTGGGAWSIDRWIGPEPSDREAPLS